MPAMQPALVSSPILRRYNGGAPVLTAEQTPYPSSLVFNAAAIRYEGRYIICLLYTSRCV